jgi:hypothetical protein
MTHPAFGKIPVGFNSVCCSCIEMPITWPHLLVSLHNCIYISSSSSITPVLSLVRFIQGRPYSPLGCEMRSQPSGSSIFSPLYPGAPPNVTVRPMCYIGRHASSYRLRQGVASIWIFADWVQELFVLLLELYSLKRAFSFQVVRLDFTSVILLFGFLVLIVLLCFLLIRLVLPLMLRFQNALLVASFSSNNLVRGVYQRGDLVASMVYTCNLIAILVSLAFSELSHVVRIRFFVFRQKCH